MKSPITKVSWDPGLYERIKKLADELEISVASFVRESTRLRVERTERIRRQIYKSDPTTEKEKEA